MEEGKKRKKRKPPKPAKEQLQNIRGLIHEWFRADLKGENWKYISAWYCRLKKDINCQKCDPFISVGMEDLRKKLADIDQGQARGYGHITSFACRPHGANTSNFNNSLTA